MLYSLVIFSITLLMEKINQKQMSFLRQSLYGFIRGFAVQSYLILNYIYIHIYIETFFCFYFKKITSNWLYQKRYSGVRSTGIPCFIVMRCIVIRRCCVFYRLKARPSTGNQIMTYFIVILASLWWSGTEPSISDVCLQLKLNRVP